MSDKMYDFVFKYSWLIGGVLGGIPGFALGFSNAGIGGAILFGILGTVFCAAVFTVLGDWIIFIVENPGILILVAIIISIILFWGVGK